MLYGITNKCAYFCNDADQLAATGATRVTRKFMEKRMGAGFFEHVYDMARGTGNAVRFNRKGTKRDITVIY